MDDESGEELEVEKEEGLHLTCAVHTSCVNVLCNLVKNIILYIKCKKNLT